MTGPSFVSISHLYNSVVAVYRISMTPANGRPSYTFEPQSYPLDSLRCRLDLTFQRPGKDMPIPLEAGKAPSRIGVLFCDAEADLRAGDLLVTQDNDYGFQPVSGTFEVRVVPDVAQAWSYGHHIEVQIVESSQKLGVPVFPGSE